MNKHKQARPEHEQPQHTCCHRVPAASMLQACLSSSAAPRRVHARQARPLALFLPRGAPATARPHNGTAHCRRHHAVPTFTASMCPHVPPRVPHAPEMLGALLGCCPTRPVTCARRAARRPAQRRRPRRSRCSATPASSRSCPHAIEGALQSCPSATTAALFSTAFPRL